MTIKKNLSPEIMKGARKYLVRSFIAPIIMALIFFLAAGRSDLPRAWYYFVLFGTYASVTGFIFYKLNPELMYHRNKWKQDAKKWDRVLMPFAVFIGFHFQFLIMGLDVRFGWSNLDSWLMIPGTIIWVASNAITMWAMHKNKHFETTVRIQSDRDHLVIKDGPYGFVRHPGYVGAILYEFAVPLIIGSVYGFINAAISTCTIYHSNV